MADVITRPARGRPKGSRTAVTAQARAAAAETGLLPHEWLLAVARGEGIKHSRWVIKYDGKGEERSREVVTEEVYADFATRIDAAKAAASYWAPRLASQTVSVHGSPEDVEKTLKELAEKLPV